MKAARATPLIAFQWEVPEYSLCGHPFPRLPMKPKPCRGLLGDRINAAKYRTFQQPISGIKKPPLETVAKPRTWRSQDSDSQVSWASTGLVTSAFSGVPQNSSSFLPRHPMSNRTPTAGTSPASRLMYPGADHCQAPNAFSLPGEGGSSANEQVG